LQKKAAEKKLKAAARAAAFDAAPAVVDVIDSADEPWRDRRLGSNAAKRAQADFIAHN